MSDLVWKRINGATTWVALSRVRNSFFSRAMTALSLSALVLANIPAIVVALGGDTGSLSFTFFGSVVFLVGYLLFGFQVPREFSHQGEVYEHVKRILDFADSSLLSQRIRMAEALVERMKKQEKLRAPAGLVQTLETATAQAKKSSGPFDPQLAARLFRSDLELRQYDSPYARIIIAAVIVSGIVLLAIPTGTNVYLSLFG